MAKEKLKGRRVPANYTWRAIDTNGAVPTVERVVSRKNATEAYRVLVEMGLKEKSFEAVVLRNKAAFTGKAIAASAARLLENA
jgi:transposase-like protein